MRPHKVSDQIAGAGLAAQEALHSLCTGENTQKGFRGPRYLRSPGAQVPRRRAAGGPREQYTQEQHQPWAGAERWEWDGVARPCGVLSSAWLPPHTCLKNTVPVPVPMPVAP